MIADSTALTSYRIYFHDLPVFHDADRLPEQAHQVSFATAPATNAGAVCRKELCNADRIGLTMLARIDEVLSLAVAHSHGTLPVQAWGGGVSANNPADVANRFARQRAGIGPLRTAYQRVTFVVLETSQGRSATR